MSLTTLQSVDDKFELYTNYRASCSSRLRIALNLKNITPSYHYIDILDDEQYGAIYARINPSRSVPTLIIASPDGTTLKITQSISALAYLEEAYPGLYPLLPKSIRARATVRSLVAIIACDTQPVAKLRVLRNIDTMGGDSLSYARKMIMEGLEAYEITITECAGKYSVGNELTLADVCLVPAIWGAEMFGVGLEELPTIKRVYDQLSGLPEVQKAHWKRHDDTPMELRLLKGPEPSRLSLRPETHPVTRQIYGLVFNHFPPRRPWPTVMAVLSDLPVELRLKIWGMVPVPRIVVLSPYPNGYVKIRFQLLPVWQVCQEARGETLKNYTEIDCYYNASQSMSIHIDFHLDRIIFKTGVDGSKRLCSFEVVENFLGEYLGRVRRCAISDNFNPFPAAALREMPLRELGIVHKGSEDACNELSSVTPWRDQNRYQHDYDPLMPNNFFLPSFAAPPTKLHSVISAYRDHFMFTTSLACSSIFIGEWCNDEQSEQESEWENEDKAINHKVIFVKRSGNERAIASYERRRDWHYAITTNG
ncbi:hypothetical protein V496_02918 [Pseudogymnoascus sp. VKM F-4515 (FW-2607)]|nr:hypothetical protein V496_02918 [Pseudogymnoascus sp. VKM F-4515 (FW-2607)]